MTPSRTIDAALESRISSSFSTTTAAFRSALCRAAGVSWAVDATNADRSRLRAALRHDVIPALRVVAPGIASTAGRVASVQRSLARELDHAAEELLERAATECDGEIRIRRCDIADAPRYLTEVALRRAMECIGTCTDAPCSSVMEKVVARIRGCSGERRMYQFRGVVIELSRHWVRVLAVERRK
ncbi:MAG: hypothetical protein KBF43_16500 [Dermatophilaceae bacterium]|nr:hypothetical protein [Dermatophilaceae bacterium]